MVVNSKRKREKDTRENLGGCRVKKIIYTIIGCAGVVMGAIGVAVPILPTVPFLMLAACCFARSSGMLDSWFKSTKLYQENLADFAAGKGMTRKAKCRIMMTVTLLMSIGLFIMGGKGILVGCVVLGCVWIFHLIYFIFCVKTIPVMEGTDL